MAKLPCNDFFTNLKLGRIEGMSLRSVHGRATVGTTTQSLYNHASVQAVSALNATPATVRVSSSSANDDKDAGTGARSVLLEGLDTNDAEISETLLLEGQTFVTSQLTYKAINRVTVATAGSSNTNEGDVWVGNGTVTAGVPATKYSNIEVGAGVGEAGCFTVPAGKKALLHTVVDRVGAVVATTGSIKVGDGNPERVVDYLDQSNGAFVYPGHHEILAGEYLRMETAVGAGTEVVALEVVLILVDV